MKPDQARQRLLAERERLRALLDDNDESAELAAANPEGGYAGGDYHLEDLAQQVPVQDVSDVVGEQLQGELVEVDAALARLDDGAYGRCEVDGAPIPDARLRVRPAARRCAQHEEAAR